MAITPTAKQQRIRAAPGRQDTIRVWYKDPDGTWRNLRDLHGKDWVMAVEWGRDKDTPVSTASITLWATEGKRSLSVNFEGSPLNKTAAGAYSPALELGTEVRIETALVAWCYRPAAADWMLVFEGYIETPPVQGDTIQLEVRSKINRLEQRFISTDRKYGGAGEMLEDVAQQIVADEGLSAEFPLWFPAVSGWEIDKEYTVSQRSVLGALLDITLKRAWAVREKLDTTVSAPAAGLAAGAWRVALMRPAYENTTPHWTFVRAEVTGTPATSPGSLSQIRNRIALSYPDSATGERLTITRDDLASQTEYDVVLTSTITEPDDSPIDSPAEAEEEADGFLLNLSVPESSMTREVDYCPWIEQDDCCEFAPDLRHADVPLKGYVTGYRHVFGGHDQRPVTVLELRGRPTGQYMASLLRALEGNGSAAPVAQVEQPVPVYGASGAFTVNVVGNDVTTALVKEEYVGGAWVNRTQFASARTGSFTGTCTSSVQQFRVAGQNGAGVVGPWKYVAISVIAVTGVQPPIHAHTVTNYPDRVEAALRGTLGLGGSGGLQVQVRDPAGAAVPGYDWVSCPVAPTAGLPITIYRVAGASPVYKVDLRYAGATSIITPEPYELVVHLIADGTTIDDGGAVIGVTNPGSGGGGYGTGGVTDGGQIAIGTTYATNAINSDFLLQTGLTSAATVQIGTTALNVARGVKAGETTDAASVTFSPPFAEIPVVRFSPGGKTNSTTPLAAGYGPVVRALNLTTSGFTTDARLVEAPGALTPRTLTFSGTDANKNYAAAAFENRYTFNFSVTVNQGEPPPGADPGSPVIPSSITLTFYTNDGTGWVSRATRTYSNPTASPITFTPEPVQVEVGNMLLDDDFRITLTGSTFNGGSVSPTSVTYNEATAPNWESMTPDGRTIPYVAIGGA